MILSVVAAVGNMGTNVCHLIFIVKGCDFNNEVYNFFETAMYMIINLLHAFAFGLCGKRFKGQLHKVATKTLRSKSEAKEYIFFSVLLALMALIGVVAPICGMVRDLQYCDIGAHLPLIFAFIHLTAKVVVSIAVTIVRAFVVMLFTNSAWKATTAHVLGSSRRVVCNSDDVGKVVSDKFYHLYSTYIYIGNKSKDQHTIMKEWFVVQYLAYVLSVLIELVHVTRKILKEETKEDEDSLDIAHSVLYLCFYLLAFLIPYLIGTLLNEHHNAYYEKMIATYLEVDIKKDDNSRSTNTEKTFLFKPGNEPHEEKNAKVFISEGKTATCTADIISAGNEVAEATLSLGNTAKAILRGISLNGAVPNLVELTLGGDKTESLIYMQQIATKVILLLNREGPTIKAVLKFHKSSDSEVQEVELTHESSANSEVPEVTQQLPRSVSKLTLECPHGQLNAKLSWKDLNTNEQKDVFLKPRHSEPRDETARDDNQREGCRDALTANKPDYSKAMKDMYVQYYNQAMIKNLPQKTKFDFVPAVFNISVPLDNNGYTFAVLLTLVSIIFNFGTIDLF